MMSGRFYPRRARRHGNIPMTKDAPGTSTRHDEYILRKSKCRLIGVQSRGARERESGGKMAGSWTPFRVFVRPGSNHGPRLNGNNDDGAVVVDSGA